MLGNSLHLGRVKMKANDYQTKAQSFAVYPGKEYPFLALSEETGEVSGKLAKYVRKNNCTLEHALEVASCTSTELHKDLKGELGGVMWNIAAAAGELNISLAELMADNITVLEGRKSRGTIVGSGDLR